MIEERIEYFHGVTPIGTIEVRQDTIVMRDGKEIGRDAHRHVLAPGDSLEGQNPRAIAIAGVIWTDELVAAYQASIAPVDEVAAG